MAGCEDGRVTRGLHGVWQSRMNTLLGRELNQHHGLSLSLVARVACTSATECQALLRRTLAAETQLRRRKGA